MKYLLMMEKYAPLAMFLAVIFATAAGACAKKGKANSSQQALSLAGTWIHSFEDEQGEDGIKCFRPSTYSFPPARGRGGIKFDTNGAFAELRIAPNDAGHVEYPGTYSLEGGKTLHINMQDGRHLHWEVVSFENGLLKLKQ